MYFLMICRHGDQAEIAALRDALRAEHRAWVRTGGDGLARVLTGSALWDEAGAGIGNFGILEAETEADARGFAEGDPFATGGVVARITLTRLADGFRADRIVPLTEG
ncbi:MULTISPECIES: YciI family protein [Roseicyclus]|jgi:hypothetical protein|uniref:YciI family protein n=1 Tax=Roseicyclus amphidinii TaxID=3034232 RepID=UPI0024E08CE3|nr:YciI family protein [Roseicyclus sp. Amp-Y-6]